MSDEAQIAIGLVSLGVLVVLAINAIRESRAMNKQHQASVDQGALQQDEFDQLVSTLQQQPLDTESHHALLSFCKQKRIFRGQAYNSALNLVSQTGGETTVKQLAYEIGRMSYGPKRRDGRPTVADELEIQSEINSRCGSM